MKRLIIAIMLTLFLAGSALATQYPSVEASIKYYNCTPNTKLGGVKWNDDKTDYEVLPNLRFESDGTKTIAVEPGTYAITHFRPPQIIVDTYGNVVGQTPPTILEYMDDVVVDSGLIVFLYFGCE